MKVDESTKEKFTEKSIEEMLKDACTEWELNFMPHVKDVCTFEEAGILTNNNGVVIEMVDGTEFQITIVQSK